MPPVPAAGVPLSTPVAALNVTPVGSGRSLSLSVGVGIPVVVTVKLPAVPVVKVVLVALVIAGAWLTVRVKVWVAWAVTSLAAVNVRRRSALPMPRVRLAAPPLVITAGAVDGGRWRQREAAVAP